ncbi:MAG: EutN/CcmL family microcompartment protein [Spirochaetaceae bacterium]|nr:MAG: EutN/CcmL family microcompartment protein [Spirochaetaceae bacterium]
MKLGRIIGSVMCTQKVESFRGVKLLLLQPVDEKLEPSGEPLIACDPVQAGPGDLVLWDGGREAALALENWYNPSDATVMGIVDQVYGQQGQGTQSSGGRK